MRHSKLTSGSSAESSNVGVRSEVPGMRGTAFVV